MSPEMRVGAALAVLLGFLLTTVALSFARDTSGRFHEKPADVREWLRKQKVPGGNMIGQLCCNEADGVEAEEDIRDGHYWSRWRYTGRDGVELTTEWTPVPDEVVIRDPNKNGMPVVWWYYTNGRPTPRCYSPGAGI